MQAEMKGSLPIINLPGTYTLLRRAWGDYKRLLKPLATLAVFLGLGIIVAFSFSSLLHFFVRDAAHGWKAFMEVLTLLISLAAGVYYSYIFGAMLIVIRDRNTLVMNAMMALQKAKEIYKSLFWVGLLLGFVVYGAVFTIVLPVLMSVWFYFALYAVVGEGARGFEALALSRYLTRGLWFKTLGRYVAISVIVGAILLVSLLVLAIPVAGWILFALTLAALFVFVLPFVAVYDYIRYEDLHAVPRSRPFEYFTCEKHMWATFTIVGLVFMMGGWSFNLLSCQGRLSVLGAGLGAAEKVLLPVVSSAAKNGIQLGEFMDRISYAYTPQCGLGAGTGALPPIDSTYPASGYTPGMQYDTDLYPSYDDELYQLSPDFDINTLDLESVDPSLFQ